MIQYQGLLHRILDNGTWTENRTGVRTITSLGHALKFDLREGFPAVTTKKLYFEHVVNELVFFIRGLTDNSWLNERGTHIWDEWAGPDGDLGPVYGYEWRRFNCPYSKGRPIVKDSLGISAPMVYREGSDDALVRSRGFDQLLWAENELRTNPDSRQIVVSAWNPLQIPQMVLPPCFVASSLVSTNQGYRPIEDIQAGEKIAEGIVSKAWETPYYGTLIELQPHYQNVPIVCTPNHPFLAKLRGKEPSWVDAGNLTEYHYVAIPAQGVNRLKTIPLQHRNQWGTTSKGDYKLTCDDYFTLGYFLGNGWCCHNKQAKKSARISFAVPDKKVGGILPALRRTLKVSKKPGVGQNCGTYETISKKWISTFREFGRGAANKQIPLWVLNSPPPHLSHFLDGYMEADGYRKSSACRRSTTVSLSLAYGIQAVCARLGHACSVRFQAKQTTHVIEGRTVNQRNLYHVESNTNNCYYTIVGKRNLWVKLRSVRRLPKTETTVYNLEISGGHVYTVSNILNHNCHVLFQLRAINGGLHLTIYQRSCDMFLGVPFNIASYALLCHMLAATTGLKPRELIWFGNDCHIYENHQEQVRELLGRQVYSLPSLGLGERASVVDFEPSDAALLNYRHHPAIKAKVAV